jgi:hypothetical protein
MGKMADVDTDGGCWNGRRKLSQIGRATDRKLQVHWWAVCGRGRAQVLAEGSMATMDYREDRVRIHVNDGVVVAPGAVVG